MEMIIFKMHVGLSKKFIILLIVSLIGLIQLLQIIQRI